jgi:hypothetical protein
MNLQNPFVVFAVSHRRAAVVRGTNGVPFVVKRFFQETLL